MNKFSTIENTNSYWLFVWEYRAVDVFYLKNRNLKFPSLFNWCYTELKINLTNVNKNRCILILILFFLFG